MRRADLEPGCELLAVQIGGRSPVIVAVCYRPPEASDDIDKIISFVERVRAAGRPLILVGDFNLPEIRWPERQDPVLLRRSARAIQFIDGVSVHDLDQTVSAPTRGDATLDLVLTCGGEAVSVIRDGTFDSDHREIVTCFTVSSPLFAKVSRSRAFNYKSADFDGLRGALNCLPWNIMLAMDVDSAADTFYDLVNAAIADYVPTVELGARFPPWFDRDVKSALRLKEASFRRKKILSF